jgi:ABC-type Fe3+/spermidine/putrescine transport system ATPase subunit
LISIRDLNLKLGEFSLINVNLEIKQGEYFVVLGPTGAGKTLIIESIAGLLRPDKGEVWIAGTNVTKFRPEDRRIGYLPQDYALFPHLSVRKNIAFGMKLARRPNSFITARVTELASILGITHLLERDVIHLSGGECQRAGLARALAIEPKVLLLDEPLSALDEQTRENICGELRRVHEEFGTTTVHISHSFEETLALADRIAIMNAGRIEQIGPPAIVMSQPKNEFVAGFVRCQNVLAGKALPEGSLTRVELENAAVYSTCKVSGEASIVVRPENIELSLSPPAQSRMNVFRGKVNFVMDKGALIRVDLSALAAVKGSENSPAKVNFTALCARKQSEVLALTIGQELYLSFDPSAVHIINKNNDQVSNRVGEEVSF